MKTKLFKISTLVLFLGFGQLANAAVIKTTDVTIGKGVVSGSTAKFSTNSLTDKFTSATSFDDKWVFNISKNTTFSTSFNYLTSSISGFAGVLKDNLGNLTTFNALNTSKTAPKIGLTNFELVAGRTYTVELTGNAKAGAAYGSLSSFVTAVPEAEEWAMMLVGLGLISVQLSRKNNQNNSMIAVA